MSTKVDLSNSIFHDEEAAREHLESLLWPNGAVCLRCGVIGDRITKLVGASTRPGVYKCKDCRKPFTVTVNTVMERSKVPLTKWLLAAQFMASSKKDMSAHQLHRMLGTNYETAWFLFHRLREAAADPMSGPIGGEGKTVEVDETYIGGKEKNKHRSKRLNAGRGPVGKAPVVSLVERDGKTRSFHVANVTAKTLRPILLKYANAKSRPMTDESEIYPKIGEAFTGHGTVNHGAGEYVKPGATDHTNTVESHFARFKRGVRHLSQTQRGPLHRYLAEFDFRANTRDLTDVERSDALMADAKGKRLTYRQPD